MISSDKIQKLFTNDHQSSELPSLNHPTNLVNFPMINYYSPLSYNPSYSTGYLRNHHVFSTMQSNPPVNVLGVIGNRNGIHPNTFYPKPTSLHKLNSNPIYVGKKSVNNVVNQNLNKNFNLYEDPEYLNKGKMKIVNNFTNIINIQNQKNNKNLNLYKSAYPNLGNTNMGLNRNLIPSDILRNNNKDNKLNLKSKCICILIKQI